jgi:hypothetical protein
MSKKKGAKGMPNDGPGKHDPSKPQKNKSDAPLFDKKKGGITNERPRKTRIWGAVWLTFDECEWFWHNSPDKSVHEDHEAELGEL